MIIKNKATGEAFFLLATPIKGGRYWARSYETKEVSHFTSDDMQVFKSEAGETLYRITQAELQDDTTKL